MQKSLWSLMDFTRKQFIAKLISSTSQQRKQNSFACACLLKKIRLQNTNTTTTNIKKENKEFYERHVVVFHPKT